MKRLITLSGPGGRAVLELGEEARLSVPAGRLYLADSRGSIRSPARPSPDIIGGFVTEGSRILMQGCLAGYTGPLARARAELVMMLAPNAPAAPAPAPPAPKAPEQHMPPGQGSAVLMDILQRAARLFPPEQPMTPARQQEGSTIVNPFPEAFPFSRWRRVEYPGTDSCYLEGEARKNGRDYLIHALPGDRRTTPPPGFSRFLRSRDGSGFWVRVRRK